MHGKRKISSLAGGGLEWLERALDLVVGLDRPVIGRQPGWDLSKTRISPHFEKLDFKIYFENIGAQKKAP